MNSGKFKIGDLVSHRGTASMFGLVVKVHKARSDMNEYSVSWLRHGRSRCTEGILEIISKA